MSDENSPLKQAFSELTDVVSQTFSLPELKQLASYLEVKLQDLPTNSRIEFVFELVQYFRRRNMLDEFSQCCQRERPNISWSEYFANIRPISANTLQEALILYFSKVEFESLCQDLEIYHENIRGNTQHEKSYDLLKLVSTRGQTKQLKNICEKNRPKVDWNILFQSANKNLAPELHIPFQAQKLPARYVPRESLIQETIIQLEPNQPDQAPFVGLLGQGGMGKSTLAIAIAHDETKIADYYPDGILWATLGQTPNLLEILNSWMQELGETEVVSGNEEIVAGRLRSLLRRKRILIIIDDAWREDHVRPLLVGGNACGVLLTTRQKSLVEGLKAHPIEIEKMTPEEALKLLSRGQSELSETDKSLIQQLAEELEHYPLALDLVGAQAQKMRSWPVFIEHWNRQILFDSAVIHRSLEISLNNLNDVQKTLYQNLCIVRKGARFPVEMAKNLIDRSYRDQTEFILHDLADQALLVVHHDGDKALFSFHSILQDLIKTRLGEEQLGTIHEKLLELYQSKLEDGLWHTVPDDGYVHNHLFWHFEQLGWFQEVHNLLQEETNSGLNGWHQAREKLGQLTGYLEDIERAWQIARENFRRSQQAVDLGHQIRYALIIASLNSLAGNLPPELLFGLVNARIWTADQAFAYAFQNPVPQERSLALKMLLPMLIETKDQNDILVVLKEIEGTELRKEAVCSIANFLAKNLSFKQVLNILGNSDPERKQDIYFEFAPMFPEALQEAKRIIESATSDQQGGLNIKLIDCFVKNELYKEAYDIVKAAGDDLAMKVQGLLSVYKFFDEDTQKGMLLDALWSYEKMIFSQENSFLIVELAKQTKQYETIQRGVFEIVKRMKHGKIQASLLADIAPFLSSSLVNEAWEIWSDFVFDAVANQEITTSETERWLRKFALSNDVSVAIDASEKIRNKVERANALIRLASSSSNPQATREEALKTVLQISQETKKINTLIGLLKDWPLKEQESIVNIVKEIAISIQDNFTRAEAYFLLAPLISDEEERELYIVEAFAIVQRESIDLPTKADRLISSLPRFNSIVSKRIVQELVLLTKQDVHHNTRKQILGHLVKKLVEIGWNNEALVIARLIEDDQEQKETYWALGSRLATRGLVGEAINIISKQEVNDLWKQDLESYIDLLNTVKKIPDQNQSDYGPLTKVAIVDHNGSGSVQIELACLLAHAAGQKAIEGNEDRLSILKPLAFLLAQASANSPLYLREKNKNTALVIGEKILHPLTKALLWVDFAYYFGEHERCLNNAVAIINQIYVRNDPETQQGYAEALSELALAMAERGFELQAVDVVKSIPFEWQNSIQLPTLTKLVMYFDSAEKRKEMIQLIIESLKGEKIWIESKQIGKILVDLSTYPEITAHINDAIQIGLTIISPIQKAEALIALTRHVSKTYRTKVIEDLFSEMLTLRSSMEQVELLILLVAELPDSRVQDAIRKVTRIDDRLPRRKALTALVNTLESFPKSSLTSLWLNSQPELNFLVSSAKRNRRQMLSDLIGLELLIATIGGIEAIKETAEAIRLVCRWWP